MVSPPEERKYKCHLCPYAAKCRANLNQHLTVHSVKLVSTDTEDIVSAVTSEGGDGKKHPYYYRWVKLAAACPSSSDPFALMPFPPCSPEFWAQSSLSPLGGVLQGRLQKSTGLCGCLADKVLSSVAEYLVV